MKRILFFVILCLGLVGCGTSVNEGKSQNGSKVEDVKNNEQGITGYVMQKMDNRMLVVSDVPQNFSDTGGLNEFYNAIMLSNMPGEIELGQKVKVIITGPIAESYPAQAEADRVKVLPSIKPTGANLSREEALKKALTDKENEINGYTVAVKELNYENESDSWKVLLKDTINNKEMSFQIEDN
jgi:hypothetical protein